MRFTIAAVVLVGVLLSAGAWGYAQGVAAQAVTPQPVPPVVLSGNDIGFRMVASAGGKAVGRLVVRVDGQWVEAEFSSGVVRIQK